MTCVLYCLRYNYKIDLRMNKEINIIIYAQIKSIVHQ